MKNNACDGVGVTESEAVGFQVTLVIDCTCKKGNRGRSVLLLGKSIIAKAKT
jgi:hypothetical protein